MSRFLRRAAFAAAVGGVLYAAEKGRNPSEPLPRPGPSSPLSPSTTGHLALVRAHPDLRELNALLTPRSFLIDATQAFLASALRCAPSLPPELRQRRDDVSNQILSAEAKGDAQEASRARLQLAMHDARDGRLEDALGACTRVAAEEPNKPIAPLIAAVLCHMLGRSEVEARWVQRVPHLSNPEVKEALQELQALVVLKATLGCAPAAARGGFRQARPGHHAGAGRDVDVVHFRRRGPDQEAPGSGVHAFLAPPRGHEFGKCCCGHHTKQLGKIRIDAIPT